MTRPIKTGYVYLTEGAVFLNRGAVEAYIKDFITDLADAPRSAFVTEIDEDFNVTYLVDPADCTTCWENDIENNETYCNDHPIDDYQLDTEVMELWGVVTP